MEQFKFENYGKNIDDLDLVEKNFFEELDLIISESDIEFEINDYSEQELFDIFNISQEDEALISMQDDKFPSLIAEAIEINELVSSAAIDFYGSQRDRIFRKLSITRKWDSTTCWHSDPVQGPIKHSAGDKFAATYLFFSQSDLKDVLVNTNGDLLKFSKVLANHTFDNLSCLIHLIRQLDRAIINGQRWLNYKIDTEYRIFTEVTRKLYNLVSQSMNCCVQGNTAKCTYLYSYMINVINHTINMLRAMLMNTLGKCGDFDIAVVVNSYVFNSNVSFKCVNDICYTSDITNSCFRMHFNHLQVIDSIKTTLYYAAQSRIDDKQYDFNDLNSRYYDNDEEEI